MNLELTDNEAQTLTGLIDLAIKAGGLQVAEAGVVLAGKIAQAAQAKPAPAPAPAPAPEGAAP
jgi:hypothetical protein